MVLWCGVDVTGSWLYALGAVKTSLRYRSQVGQWCCAVLWMSKVCTVAHNIRWSSFYLSGALEFEVALRVLEKLCICILYLHFIYMKTRVTGSGPLKRVLENPRAGKLENILLSSCGT